MTHMVMPLHFVANQVILFADQENIKIYASETLLCPHLGQCKRHKKKKK